MDREHIQIYTRSWRDDTMLYDGAPGPPNAHVECRVFIDGKEVIGAIGAAIHSDSGFTEVSLRIAPGQLEWHSLTEEQWRALGSTDQAK